MGLLMGWFLKQFLCRSLYWNIRKFYQQKFITQKKLNYLLFNLLQNPPQIRRPKAVIPFQTTQRNGIAQRPFPCGSFGIFILINLPPLPYCRRKNENGTQLNGGCSTRCSSSASICGGTKAPFRAEGSWPKPHHTQINLRIRWIARKCAAIDEFSMRWELLIRFRTIDSEGEWCKDGTLPVKKYFSIVFPSSLRKVFKTSRKINV